MMTRRRWFLLLWCLAFWCLPGCASGAAIRATSATNATGGGERPSFVYYYEPQSQVYYAPDLRRYFWMQSGAWITGSGLPASIPFDRAQVVKIHLHSESPIAEHAAVAAQYPPDGRRGKKAVSQAHGR